MNQHDSRFYDDTPPAVLGTATVRQFWYDQLNAASGLNLSPLEWEARRSKLYRADPNFVPDYWDRVIPNPGGCTVANVDGKWDYRENNVLLPGDIYYSAIEYRKDIPEQSELRKQWNDRQPNPLPDPVEFRRSFFAHGWAYRRAANMQASAEYRRRFGNAAPRRTRFYYPLPGEPEFYVDPADSEYEHFPDGSVGRKTARPDRR